MYILNCSHEKILTTSRYYATSFFTGSMMINYRVEDLHGLLDELKKEGINPVDKIDTASYVTSFISWTWKATRLSFGRQIMMTIQKLQTALHGNIIYIINQLNQSL